MKSFFLFLGTLFLSLVGCKSYTYQELPAHRLVFGNGGGITGASDTYTLLENGQLFHLNSMTKDSTELQSIPRKEAKELFEKLSQLSMAEMDFDHPGNIYYFIEEQNDTLTNKVVWGSLDHEIFESCKNLYESLKEHVK